VGDAPFHSSCPLSDDRLISLKQNTSSLLSRPKHYRPTRKSSRTKKIGGGHAHTRHVLPILRERFGFSDQPAHGASILQQHLLRSFPIIAHRLCFRPLINQRVALATLPYVAHVTKMVPSKRSSPSSSLDEERKPSAAEAEEGEGSRRKQVRLNVPPPPPLEERGVDDAEGPIPVQVAQAVTPSSARGLKSPPVGEDDAQQEGSARRAIFATPSAAASSATTITPPKDPSPAKRRLAFGRSIVETVVKDSVRQVYGIVKKLTGSIGGNGAFGPIYGELTMGSMQKMINLMKEHTGFDSSSRFIDVGSGIGKPNLHVTQDPGVAFSYGIEIEESRWLLGLNCLKGMLDAAHAQHLKQTALRDEQRIAEEERIQHRCFFAHGDICAANSFDPFTHVYMFSIGFPPRLWEVLAEMWNRSSSSLYLICYHGPKDIIQAYEFDVELVVQIPTSMHGSKEGHMGYIYKRTASPEAPTNAPPPCDPFFASAWTSVQNGLESLREEVDATVRGHMQSGTSTRARRRQSLN